MRHNSPVEERLGPYKRDRGQKFWESAEKRVVPGDVRLIDGVLMACTSNDYVFGTYLTTWWPVDVVQAELAKRATK